MKLPIGFLSHSKFASWMVPRARLAWGLVGAAALTGFYVVPQQPQPQQHGPIVYVPAAPPVQLAPPTGAAPARHVRSKAVPSQ